jgi:hypothetical protein
MVSTVSVFGTAGIGPSVDHLSTKLQFYYESRWLLPTAVLCFLTNAVGVGTFKQVVRPLNAKNRQA